MATMLQTRHRVTCHKGHKCCDFNSQETPREMRRKGRRREAQAWKREAVLA